MAEMKIITIAEACAIADALNARIEAAYFAYWKQEAEREAFYWRADDVFNTQPVV